MFVEFAVEFPARLAPLLRMLAIVHMTPQERHAVDMYLDEVESCLHNGKRLEGTAINRHLWNLY